MTKQQCLIIGILVIANLSGVPARAQQIADRSFQPPIGTPAYPPGQGLLVLLDQAHFNLHTAEGRFQPFVELLRRDGYIIKPSSAKFDKTMLEPARILVIPTALAERNSSESDWSLPTPSAFSVDEIRAVQAWVRKGGALWLIADHMPFSGAVQQLAQVFGVRFSNGFARDPAAPGEPTIFRRTRGTLLDHPITQGREAAEKIAAIATFTGSAFKLEKDAQPILILGSSFISWLPRVAWEFRFDTKRIPVGGWCQGATMRYGKGRVAIFGDATMFTAQLRGPAREPLGMNQAVASQNSQFTLNVVHWLSGLLGK